jgi:hypothetical protein
MKPVCTYCENIADTRDHVPPKKLFAGLEQNLLVTVPSCGECNHGFAKDDEYFKVSLSLRPEVRKSRHGRTVARSALRGLLRPEGAAFAEQVKSTLRLPTPEEISPTVQPNIFGQVPDFERIRPTVSRIVRGLHRHETGNRLPLDCHVRGAMLELYREFDRPLILSIHAGCTPIDLANGQFAYVRRPMSKDENVASWLFMFHSSIIFHGTSLRPLLDGLQSTAGAF